MLTELATLKARLEITVTTYDAILTNAIKAVSARFDKECNRVFARDIGITQEFTADRTEILAACYPVEAVTKFELKSTEAEGWVEQTGTDYLLRRSCVVSLLDPLGSCTQQARINYTGGYILPGSSPGPGQTPLPDELEQAAVEQVAAWFPNRDKGGLEINWPHGGIYQRFSQLPLLPAVQVAIARYKRWVL